MSHHIFQLLGSVDNVLLHTTRHVTGNDFVIDGFDVGGVFGNGQTWYSWARGQGGVFGRYV